MHRRTAPSLPSTPPTQGRLHTLTPRPLRRRPRPQPSRRPRVALQLLSNTTEARRLLLNSRSTRLSPLPPNSSFPLPRRHPLPPSLPFLPPPTRVLRRRRATLLLPWCPSHSSPSRQPSSPPSPQHLHLPAISLLSPARLPPPRAPSHLKHPLPPLSRALFRLLSRSRCLPGRTQAPCRPNSSTLRPSHPPTTRVPLLQGLRCLPLPWPRATTCRQGLRARRGLPGPCSSLPLSLACREDTPLSRMVRSGR